MAKDASVAPKERVNILYRPATGDAQEEKELPMKTLVVGDFTGREDSTAVEDRKPVSVDKDNFNSVLEAQNVALNASVPDMLSDKPGGELKVSLDFKTMKDFEPDSVAQKVPELQQLLQLREALKALKGSLGNIPEFRKKIQELVKDEEGRRQLLKELGIEETKE
jgi:type VI secretion system protein ImpB